MATRGLLPGDLGVSASLEKLRRQFDAFYSYRTVLKESYGRVASCFHLLEADSDCDDLKTLFKEGTSTIEGILEKDPIVLIGGQLNCGKSSFINLLLNRRVVPVNEHPCTARIVRIKYSQDEYYQLTDATGNGKGPKCPLDRKTLWKEIELDEGRESRATVDEVVEIGLNSPLLESGLQIIDTPGLSENEALDAVVKQCLDGVLQVLFYVIDGNTAWRNQDANFISNIMTQSPDMKIIYICNKCEEDETAAQYDAPDGDEDGSDNDSEVIASPIPKGTIVYTKLKNSCLLEEREDITCNRYFQISCLRLKRSRSRDYVPDEFTVEYQRLINSLCAILRHFLYHSLRQAVLTLFGIVTKCYDVCSKHERSRPQELVPVLLEKFEETHLEFVAAVFKYEDQLRNAVAGVLASKTDEVVTKSVARISELGSILERVDKKEFYHILVGLSTLAAEIASDDTVQLTMKAIESDTKAISNKFSQTCEELGAHGDILTVLKVFTDAIDKADLSEGLTSFMAHHVQNCLLQQMSSNDGERASVNCLSLDTIITLMDPAEFSGDTCRKISSEISGLGEALCLLCKLVELVNNVKENCAFSKKVRSSFPAENLILTSLLSTLQYKEVTIPERPGPVGKGNHCKVYKAKRGNMVIAARRTLAAENSEDFREMAKTYAIFRDLSNKDHLNILKPFDVGRDCTGQVLVLVPYIEKNLFEELCDGTMTQCEPEERLSVGLQIINGCMFLKEMGLEAVDLRPNNIRLQNGCPMIDISKGRAVHTPYPPPDNKPPFHFPAECIRDEQKRYPSTQDSFGCAILVWMLACGRFIRPPFATKDGPAGQGPDPTVAILCNIARVRQEFGEIIEQQCSEENQRGMFPFLPLVKTILEKCITDEMERVDVVELHEMLQSQMALIV